MTYLLAFTIWFMGANGHITKGGTYSTETECNQIAEAFNKADKQWNIDAICVKTGVWP